ncbi:hypothetical protein PM8797T_01219 [Gimesia maris DSM 8797]|nr:hypothetical protein PM8797T_01219 [Gimesia maris DSM 8797]
MRRIADPEAVCKFPYQLNLPSPQQIRS